MIVATIPHICKSRASRTPTEHHRPNIAAAALVTAVPPEGGPILMVAMIVVRTMRLAPQHASRL